MKKTQHVSSLRFAAPGRAQRKNGSTSLQKKLGLFVMTTFVCTTCAGEVLVAGRLSRFGGAIKSKIAGGVLATQSVSERGAAKARSLRQRTGRSKFMAGVLKKGQTAYDYLGGKTSKLREGAKSQWRGAGIRARQQKVSYRQQMIDHYRAQLAEHEKGLEDDYNKLNSFQIAGKASENRKRFESDLPEAEGPAAKGIAESPF